MRLSGLLISTILLLIYSSCFSQRIPDDLKSWLSSSEISKIKKADVRIDQGEQILFSKQLQSLNDTIVKGEVNYLSLSDNLIVDKRFSRLLLETKEYFATGFESKLEIYKRYLDHYLNIDTLGEYKVVHELKDSIDIYISDANFYSDKSSVKGNLIIAANAVHKSNINLQSAVLLCEKALLILKNRIYDSEVKELVVQSVSEPKDETSEKKTEIVKEEPRKEIPETVASKEIKEPIVEKSAVKPKVKVEKTKDEVYFTVQIMADKKKVAESKVRTIYKGSLPIVENQGDGWFRYSIGKFTTYPAAKKALAESKVKGYVVAYKNKVRITVREAITYLQGVN